jgi:ankyrin repeat protein
VNTTTRASKFLVLIFGCAMTLQATEIHNAVMRGDLKATQEVLKDDPKEITSLDSDGNGPLHLACEKGNKELIAVLLSAGADVNATNSKKATARSICLLWQLIPRHCAGTG